MTRHFAICVLCSTLLAGCASSPGDASGAFTQFSPGSPLMHRDSRFLFPSQIGNFRRTREMQYDRSGDDIAVGYDDRSVPVSATVFVYPVHGRPLASEFSRRQTEITDRHMGAQLVAASDLAVTPDRMAVMAASYSLMANFSGSFQSLRSDLLVGQSGDYFVEYRFTYPVSFQANAPAEVADFESRFAWP